MVITLKERQDLQRKAEGHTKTADELLAMSDKDDSYAEIELRVRIANAHATTALAYMALAEDISR